MSVVGRVAWALPTVAVAGLAMLLPAAVRPSPPAWIGGAAVLATVVCLASRRRAWTVGVLSAGTALGLLVPLRLGASTGRLGVLAVLAAALLVGGLALGRSVVARRLDDPGVLRLVGLSALVAAVVLRGVTVLGPSPASGTLPVLGIQVGELTRVLLVGGIALAVADPLRVGLRRAADRRFAAAAAGLAVVGLATLLALHDLGPAVLVVLGALAAAVHVGGLTPRRAGTGVLVLAASAPLAWTAPVVRTRFGEVVTPGPQLTAALTAAWSGGLVGPGPGRSPLVTGVPAIASDYALAALVADLGALVVLPIVLVLLAALLALVREAASGRGAGSTLAVALATVLAGQACWNALGAVAVLPLTGLNFPFLGVSGASLTTSALAVGLVLGLLEGRAPRRPAAPGTRPLALASTVALPVVAVLLVAAAVLVVVSPRTIGDAEQVRMPRGTIWTADGEVVAADQDGQRIHPGGGRYADLGFERRNDTHRGVEAVEADTLTCGGGLGPVDALAALFHPVCRTADVVTTVDGRAQAGLATVLSVPGTDGEGVLLDAPTGAVLALSSSAATRPDAGSAARSRQTAPGSTMKLITTSAALLHGVDFAGAPAAAFTGDDGTVLRNDGGATCPGTAPDTALSASCNSVLGWAAVQVGAPELARVARTYFGADETFDLGGLGASGLESGWGDVPPSTGALARAGIGQESVRSSVLGVALATAVVANGGSTTPWPRVVALVCGGDPPAPAPVVGPPLPRAVADVVRLGMRSAVAVGTARHLVVPSGHAVIAKTGTAQVGGGRIDSWITAVVDDRYVLTIVLHDAREGAAVDAASRVLAALPGSFDPPSCPADAREGAS